MRKFDFKKLALMGITGGVMCATQVSADQPTTNMDNRSATPNIPTPAKIDEAHFLKKLTPESKEMYMKMSPEGKALALKLANQGCTGKNDCKGLNSCTSANNTCAGKGGCKGTSPGPFTDMNKAVQVANKHMQEKRTKMNQAGEEK